MSNVRRFRPARIAAWIKELKQLRKQLSYGARVLLDLMCDRRKLAFTERNRVTRDEYLSQLLAEYPDEVRCTLAEYRAAVSTIARNNDRRALLGADKLRALLEAKELVNRIRVRFPNAKNALSTSIQNAARDGVLSRNYVIESVTALHDPKSERGYIIPASVGECDEAIERATVRRESEENRIADLEVLRDLVK